jgi:hypothetical protein
MKKQILLKAAIVIILSFVCVKNINASHNAGADLTYQHISGNQYLITLNFFQDCSGSAPATSHVIDFQSSCGGTFSITVNNTNPGGTEISQLCSSQIGNSTCNGGALQGMLLMTYSGIANLPPCNSWRMSWSTCCRSSSVINLATPSSNGIEVEAILNNLTDNNSSPYFSERGIPYVCAGQPLNFNSGVLEVNGDSLHYSLVGAEDFGGTSVAYSAGYSGSAPVSGLTIDPLTGMLSGTPSTVGAHAVVIMVEEYDSVGNLKGSVKRDFQFNVSSCSNNVPDASGGSITSFTGSGLQSGTNSVQLCPGDSFSFDLVFSDADAADALSYQTNLSSVFPGAIITSGGSNPLTINVSWTAPLSALPGTRAFNIDVMDNVCPVFAVQSFAYMITINSGVNGGPDQTICGPQTAMLNATGATTFNWAVISGPPIVIGTNFSCNNCANPVASPTATTVYEVTGNLSASCINVDTVVVNVVPGFSYNVVAEMNTACFAQPNQLNITGLSPGAYTYQWQPSTFLSNDSTMSPVATITAAGSHTYTVTVSDLNNCVIQDVLTINIVPFSAPNPIVSASDSSVCAGSVIQLNAVSGYVVPVCGLASSGCASSSLSVVGSGSGSNTSSTYPAPYGNWYGSVKQQYLYKASELSAAGITPGKLNQIDFNISSIAGITSYFNYSISIGCTNLSSLGSGFESGLYNVFPSQTYNITTGWNAHPFVNAYEWDGVSNIIVEVCMSQIGSPTVWTNNSISPNESTPYVSCIYTNNDAANQCTTPPSALPQQLNIHPQIRLHHCASALDSTNYIYSWIPTSGLTSPNAQITNATVNAASTYTVTVTDTVSGCSSSDSQMITLDGLNMAIKGSVDYTGSPVSGYAKLFSYVTGVQMPMMDSVAITGGNYIFLNVAPGDYIIQATPDTLLYPLAFPTYYDSQVSWDSATVVSTVFCNDTVTADISLLSYPVLTGANVLAGVLIEGTGYLHAAGMPLEDINVMLLDNVSGTAMDHVISNGGGVYQFNNVPDGCYKLYVDIPGLPMDSTYHVCVSGSDTLTDLNFIADANSVFITEEALSVNGSSSMEEIRIYPNPASDVLKISNPSGSVLMYTLYDITGKKVINEKRSVSNDIEMNTSVIDKGVYILQVSTEHHRKNYRIIKQ